jgi:hypothetical protein
VTFGLIACGDAPQQSPPPPQQPPVLVIDSQSVEKKPFFFGFWFAVVFIVSPLKLELKMSPADRTPH